MVEIYSKVSVAMKLSILIDVRNGWQVCHAICFSRLDNLHARHKVCIILEFLHLEYILENICVYKN